jgi:hypothetical protein
MEFPGKVLYGLGPLALFDSESIRQRIKLFFCKTFKRVKTSPQFVPQIRGFFRHAFLESGHPFFKITDVGTKQDVSDFINIPGFCRPGGSNLTLAGTIRRAALRLPLRLRENSLWFRRAHRFIPPLNIGRL